VLTPRALGCWYVLVYSGVLYAVGEQALVIKSEGGAGARDWAAQAVPVASRYSLAAC